MRKTTTVLVLLFMACSCLGMNSNRGEDENDEGEENGTSQLRFDWITNCSTSANGIDKNIGEVLVYRYNAGDPKYKDNEIVKQHYLPDSSSSEVVKIPLVTEKQHYAFTWRNVMSVSETCCWSVANPKITHIPSNSDNVTIVADVVTCVGDQQTYLYNGMIWACSVPGISNTIQLTTNAYELTENGEHTGRHNHPCRNTTQPIIIDDDAFFKAAISNSVSASVPTTTSESSNVPVSVKTTSSVSISDGNILRSARLINTLFCPLDGLWLPTRVNTTVIGVGVCYDGTVNATRHCKSNGEWEDYQCLVTPEFLTVIDQIGTSPEEGLKELEKIITSSSNITISQAVFLLDLAIDTVLALGNVSLIDISKVFQLLIIDIIQEENMCNYSEDEATSRRSLGSQILLALDKFSLALVEPTGILIETDEFFLRVLEFDQPTDTPIIGISVDGNSITLPPEVLGQPSSEQPVRIASFLFQNLSCLLPPGNISGNIVSPVISSTTDCQPCPIDDLKENVTIQLQITEMASSNKIPLCVFFDFENQTGDQSTGDWSTSGCSTTVNGDNVTCSCNHLTHFAILLSPSKPEETENNQLEKHYEVLDTIGLVLVPISLVCMILVVLTYTLMRSLWSLRNYIHIMLCVSLFMAQLVFVIGIDRIENKEFCSAVAVILQYLFLVTFMWMLMEGVVLYVTLVRVFISSHLYYIIGFTVASYAIPAVYMSIIAPIGFLVSVEDLQDDTHFLFYNNDSLTACWLNYQSGFIWSFIVPVAVIIFANIGFFIMAIVIMRRHLKKQEKRGKTTKLKHWLKVSISLTLVMGITWLAGVLTFEEELLFVAYIITAFIAGQGILLFIILVPLSKQVREAYWNAWLKQKSKSPLFNKPSSNTQASVSSGNKLHNKGPVTGKSNGNVGGIVLGSFGPAN